MALAVGVEKMTDGAPEQVTAGLATAADQDYEASHGLGFTALSALLMRRYMEETGQGREAFAPFAVTAHRNATANPCAMFREPITAEAFARCPVVAAPIGVLDAAPICDGAAAVVVCSREFLGPRHRPVRIAASAVATDTITLAARDDILTLGAAARSARVNGRFCKTGWHIRTRSTRPPNSWRTPPKQPPHRKEAPSRRWATSTPLA